jgi:hypothetical protein
MVHNKKKETMVFDVYPSQATFDQCHKELAVDDLGQVGVGLR